MRVFLDHSAHELGFVTSTRVGLPIGQGEPPAEPGRGKREQTHCDHNHRRGDRPRLGHRHRPREHQARSDHRAANEVEPPHTGSLPGLRANTRVRRESLAGVARVDQRQDRRTDRAGECGPCRGEAGEVGVGRGCAIRPI